MSGFKITNRLQQNVQVFVSNYTNQTQGSDAWFTLEAGASSALVPRSGYEVIVFQDPQSDSALRRGWYLDCNGRTVDVNFRGFDKEVEFNHPTGFNICNASGAPIQVFVSAYTNGNDSVFDCPVDFSDYSKCHWNRNGWELLAFIDPVTKLQRGWYLATQGETVDVIFNGFDREITIIRPSKSLSSSNIN